MHLAKGRVVFFNNSYAIVGKYEWEEVPDEDGELLERIPYLGTFGIMSVHDMKLEEGMLVEELLFYNRHLFSKGEVKMMVPECSDYDDVNLVRISNRQEREEIEKNENEEDRLFQGVVVFVSQKYAIVSKREFERIVDDETGELLGREYYYGRYGIMPVLNMKLTEGDLIAELLFHESEICSKQDLKRMIPEPTSLVNFPLVRVSSNIEREMSEQKRRSNTITDSQKLKKDNPSLNVEKSGNIDKTDFGINRFLLLAFGFALIFLFVAYQGKKVAADMGISEGLGIVLVIGFYILLVKFIKDR